MKGRCVCVLVLMGLLFMSGLAQAQLTVIGTATYQGTVYNLIWDDDNNGNSVVWLDYTNAEANWQNQKDWAAGLDAQLTYNIDSQYTVTWNDAAWRLPNTVDGVWEYRCDGTETSATATGGFYFTNAEMGHLYYTELGNPGERSGGSCQHNPAWSSLQNPGPFQNLKASWYWSGTEYAASPDGDWGFYFGSGNQYRPILRAVGLALRSGQIVNGDPLDIDKDGDGFTENQGDCNDYSATVYPGAAEICGDGIDQDCNGNDLICPVDYTSGPYKYYLPYFKSGNGYWTGLGLANSSRYEASPFKVVVYGCDGRPLAEELKILPVDGQTAFPVAATLDDSGWMYVNSHQPLSGLAFLGSSGAASLMADIPFVSDLADCLVIPHIAQDNNWDTSVLICNPQSVPVVVTLTYVDRNGESKGEQSFSLAIHGSSEYDLSELSNVAMSGKVYIEASGKIAAFALYSELKSGGTYYAGINAMSCE